MSRDYLSYSAINTYRSCPLRYYFRYVQELPDDAWNDNLAFGSGIHRALELVFHSQMHGLERPSLSQLVDVFCQVWKARLPSVSSQTNDREGPSTFNADQEALLAASCEKAEGILGLFLDSNLPMFDQTVVGVEEEFRTSISEQTPDLLGRYDLMTLDEKACLHLIDFKTSKARWNDWDLIKVADQLLLTQLGLEQQFPQCGMKLTFVVLVKTKQPSLQVLEVDHNAVTAKRTLHAFRSVWNAIEQRHFYPAPSAMNCSTCPYKQACLRWPQNSLDSQVRAIDLAAA